MTKIKVDISLVTRLSDHELDDVASVSNLAYLHANSPTVRLMTGGKRELVPDLFRSMTRGCLIDGDCYIATEVTTRKIVGTALWFPPGKNLWATGEIRQHTGYNAFFDRLDQETKEWMTDVYNPEVKKFMDDYYGPETSTESWWLSSIAVHPAYQGSGIGSSLFKEALKKATASEAVGCCTDTEKNVRFYESLRMKDIGTVRIRHRGDGSGLKVWGMKRYGI